MKKILLTLMIALLLPFSVYAQGIKVDRYDVPPEQLDDAISLSVALDLMSNAVMACVEADMDHKKCICLNIDKLDNLEKIYNKLLERHPEWKGKMLYHETSTPEIPILSHNTYLPGLEKQFAMENNCK